MKTLIASVFGLVALVATTTIASAQDGCKAAQNSCTQMNATCEARCQNTNNPSTCVARSCSGALNTCKANGVWKSPGSAGCWKTNNRT